MGMTEAQLASLFEPFNRLGREHSGVEGTGIGLAITKGLVEQMGGTLSVSSQANEGSCFTLRLPLSSAAVAAPPSATEPAAEPAVPRREPPALDVLCVKDNEINAYLLQELLQRLRPAWPGRCALQPPERRPRSCCARRRPAWCDWT